LQNVSSFCNFLEREKYFGENPDFEDEDLDEDRQSLRILQNHTKSKFNALKILGFKLKEIANVTNASKNPKRMRAFGGIQRRF
jgi:Holliday junction resolvasome RuvABC DNA-binding subunit